MQRRRRPALERNRPQQRRVPGGYEVCNGCHDLRGQTLSARQGGGWLVAGGEA